MGDKENVPRKINIRLSMDGQKLFDNSSLFFFSAPLVQFGREKVLLKVI